MHTKERDLHRPKHGVIEHQLGEGPVSHRQNLVTLRAHTVSGQHLAAHPARFSLRESTRSILARITRHISPL